MLFPGLTRGWGIRLLFSSHAGGWPRGWALLKLTDALFFIKPIVRPMGHLKRVILLPNISVRQNSRLTFIRGCKGEFCLSEILGDKRTLLSCPISLAIGLMFYSILPILIYTKTQLYLAAVCQSGPCIIQGCIFFVSQRSLAALRHGTGNTSIGWVEAFAKCDSLEIYYWCISMNLLLLYCQNVS